MSLVTLLVREMQLKFFEVDQAVEMLRVPLITILAQECYLNFFFLPKPWICWECHYRHNIGARNAIESFFN